MRSWHHNIESVPLRMQHLGTPLGKVYVLCFSATCTYIHEERLGNIFREL